MKHKFTKTILLAIVAMTFGTATWHYTDIDEDETYENTVLCESGDVVTAICAQAEACGPSERNFQMIKTQ